MINEFEQKIVDTAINEAMHNSIRLDAVTDSLLKLEQTEDVQQLGVYISTAQFQLNQAREILKMFCDEAYTLEAEIK